MQFNASIIAIAAAIMAGTVSASPARLVARGGSICPRFEKTTTFGDCYSGRVPFDVFNETDFFGGDLPASANPQNPVQDVDACLKLCFENNRKNLPTGKCIGVTFNNANKRCFLKNKIDSCGAQVKDATGGLLICH